jgi:hypothetical protein
MYAALLGMHVGVRQWMACNGAAASDFSPPEHVEPLAGCDETGSRHQQVLARWQRMAARRGLPGRVTLHLTHPRVGLRAAGLRAGSALSTGRGNGECGVLVGRSPPSPPLSLRASLSSTLTQSKLPYRAYSLPTVPHSRPLTISHHHRRYL